MTQPTSWDMYLSDNNITSDMYSKYSQAEQMGLQQSFGALGGTSGYQSPIATSGGMDWLNQNSKGLGTLAGLGSLGMNAYSTFFGQGKESFDKNMKLLDQNIANNEYIAKKHAGVDAAWAKQQAKQDGLGTVVS